MATGSKTWTFAAAWPGDAESLAKLGDDPNFNLQWAPTDGNPAGSAEWFQTSGAGSTNGERARASASGTWESLFGVTPGATVTSVQSTAFDELCWSFTNITSRRIRIRLVSSTGTIIHSAGELQDLSGVPTDTTGTSQAKGAGTSRAVDAAFQASSTVIKLEIQVSIVASGTPNPVLDLEQDNIAITATYNPTTEFARPDADVTDGSWTDKTGSNTNLFQSIGEVTADDTDYIQSSASPATADVVEINLSDITP